MRSVRTLSEPGPLRLPSLLFIYVLIAVLGTLFATALFNDAFYESRVFQSPLSIIFFSLPLALLAFLVVASYKLIRDIAQRRPGSRLRSRFLIYFVIVAVLSSLPATVMITRFMDDILSPEFGLDAAATTVDARHFALDAYQYRLNFLESVVGDTRFMTLLGEQAASGAATYPPGMDPAFLAFQRYTYSSDAWVSSAFIGDGIYRLDKLPAEAGGFLPRDPIRDTNCIRYIALVPSGERWLITFSLGADFDSRVERLEVITARLDSFTAFRLSFRRFVVFLNIAFSLPTLLMTLIIAFTLSAKLTQPIVALADATKRVAEGDFSIRILSRPRDELGALVESFNEMVRDLESTQAALLRNEKINVWKDMAQRLAHELKNPLTPIRLSAERVLRRYRTEPESLNEIVEASMLSIIQEVEGLATLLANFREFARLPPPTLTWTALGELLEETISTYRNSYPGIHFDTDNVRSDLVVRIDRRQMTQILTNLILNAAEAMERQGRLDFATDLVKKRNRGYCRLSVRDDGRGIAEKDRALIFTPYFTTKSTGTGLGLSIVERIVSDHGGVIWFDSAEQVGTTFYIDLPIDAASTAADEDKTET